MIEKIKPNSKVLRILAVDDHDIVRVGLRSLLKSKPHWHICGEASSGREAIVKAKKLRPDVLLLDLYMPGLPGLETIHRICRALPATEILALAERDSDQLEREVFDAGARGFISKTNLEKFLVLGIESLAAGKPFFGHKTTDAILMGELRLPPSPREPHISGQQLTSKETEILHLIVEGRSNKKIAAILGRSVKTVEAHRASVMRKLALNSVAQLVHYAIRNKLVES